MPDCSLVIIIFYSRDRMSINLVIPVCHWFMSPSLRPLPCVLAAARKEGVSTSRKKRETINNRSKVWSSHLAEERGRAGPVFTHTHKL